MAEETRPGQQKVMDAETAKRRRKGNIVIALSIIAFVALIFGITIVKLSGNIAASGAGG